MISHEPQRINENLCSPRCKDCRRPFYTLFFRPSASYAVPTMIPSRPLLARMPRIRSLISPRCTFVSPAERNLHQLLPLFAQGAASPLFLGKERATLVLSASLRKGISERQGPSGYMTAALWRPFICLSTERRVPCPGH